MTFGTDIELDEARRIISIYRDTNWKIANVWADANYALKYMYNGESLPFGRDGAIEIVGDAQAIKLPSGLLMRYEELEGSSNEEGTDYTYKTRRGRTKIYGGKIIENVCQALARCIIAEQMLDIAKKYRPVLTVHDSVVACVPEDEIDEGQAYIEACMRRVPTWADGLPLDCESGVAKAYGDC